MEGVGGERLLVEEENLFSTKADFSFFFFFIIKIFRLVNFILKSVRNVQRIS
jgi:hypothetical protein